MDEYEIFLANVENILASKGITSKIEPNDVLSNIHILVEYFIWFT